MTSEPVVVSQSEEKSEGEKQEPFEIIMPTHDHLTLTLKAIEALYANTALPFKLTIVDDSKDHTYDNLKWLQEEKGNINLIHSDVAYTHCNQIINIGLQNTQGAVVAYLGNNVRVEPDWLEDGLSIMLGEEKIAIMGFKLLFPTGVIEHAGIVYEPGMPSHMNIGVGEAGHRHTRVREVTAVGFALCLLRRAAFPQGLDDKTYLGFRGFDDIDACLDAHKRDWKIVYCGVGAAYHEAGATSRQNPNFGRETEINRQIFLKKWGQRNA